MHVYRRASKRLRNWGSCKSDSPTSTPSASSKRRFARVPGPGAAAPSRARAGTVDAVADVGEHEFNPEIPWHAIEDVRNQVLVYVRDQHRAEHHAPDRSEPAHNHHREDEDREREAELIGADVWYEAGQERPETPPNAGSIAYALASSVRGGCPSRRPRPRPRASATHARPTRESRRRTSTNSTIIRREDDPVPGPQVQLVERADAGEVDLGSHPADADAACRQRLAAQVHACPLIATRSMISPNASVTIAM